MEDEEEDAIKLTTENKSFVVSRTELARNSLYYERLLCSGMKDADSKDLKLLSLCDAGLCAVAEYLKKGSVSGLQLESSSTDDDSSWENFKAVFEAGSYLQMDGLVSICKEYLTSIISVKSWKEVLDLANDYYLNDVKVVVLKYLCEHFTTCFKAEDFLLLPKEDLLSVLGSDDTDGTEQEIFDAALAWISFDHSRFDDVAEVFDTVRFPLMTDVHFKDSRHSLCTLGFPELSTKIEEETHNLKSNYRQLISAKANKKLKRRCTLKAVLATGGFTSKEHSTSRLQLVPCSVLDNCQSAESGSIALLSCRNEKLLETVCEHGCCVVNNVLYIAGGQHQYCRDGRYTTNRVYCFDPVLEAWSLCASMQVPRSLFYFGELNGSLYAVTGCTSPNADTPTVERYLPAEDKWEMLNPVPAEVHELAGCNHDGTFYISGGFRGPVRGHVDLVWRYNKSEDRWEKRASMLAARSYHAMTSTGRFIMVAGGVKYLGGNDLEDILSCEIYDPQHDQWTVVAKLEHAASCMSHVEVNGNMFLFGGHSFQHSFGHNYLQIVDLQTFKCSSITFEAHKILFFETAIIELQRNYVSKFR